MGGLAGAIGGRDAGEQHLSGMRRAHPTGLLGAIKRKRVCPEVITPKGAFETLRKFNRFGIKLPGPFEQAHSFGATRG